MTSTLLLVESEMFGEGLSTVVSRNRFGFTIALFVLDRAGVKFMYPKILPGCLSGKPIRKPSVQNSTSHLHLSDFHIA